MLSGHDPIWRIGQSGEKIMKRFAGFITCNELGSFLLIHRKILRQDLMIISGNIYIEFV
jgi:hypothetical protein